AQDEVLRSPTTFAIPKVMTTGLVKYIVKRRWRTAKHPPRIGYNAERRPDAQPPPSRAQEVQSRNSEERYGHCPLVPTPLRPERAPRPAASPSAAWNALSR